MHSRWKYLHGWRGWSFLLASMSWAEFIELFVQKFLKFISWDISGGVSWDFKGSVVQRGGLFEKGIGDLNKGCYIQIASQRWSNRRSRIRKLLRPRRRTILILPSDLQGFTWFNGDKLLLWGTVLCWERCRFVEVREMMIWWSWDFCLESFWR